MEGLRSVEQRRDWRLRMAAGKWNIFSKATLGNTRAVVRYLARYTSRVGIANQRLLDLDEKKRALTFQYIDYRGGGRIRRTMTLPVGHFLLRFAQHILPKGLVRVRWFGFLSSASRFHGSGPLSGKDQADGSQSPKDEFRTNRKCSCGHSNWTTPVRIPYVSSDSEPYRGESSKAFPLAATPLVARSPTSR